MKRDLSGMPSVLESEPLISFIVPAFNAGSTIRRALQSFERIDNNDRTSVEIILINDGSLDNTLIELEAFARSGNWRCMVIDQSNRGPASARNAGLARATGKWIMFLDADDELATNLVPVIAVDHTSSCVGFAVEYRSNDQLRQLVRPRRFANTEIVDQLTAANPFPICSLIFRREAITHGFDEDLRCLEDWVFWGRNLSILDLMGCHRDIRSAIVHMHSSNATGNYRKMGHYRAIAAERLLDCFNVNASRTQRNNLLAQKAIGRLQAGCSVSVVDLLQLPCNPVLWAKMWVYWLAMIFRYPLSLYKIRKDDDVTPSPSVP